MLPGLHTGTRLCLNAPVLWLPGSPNTFRMWFSHPLLHQACPASLHWSPFNLRHSGCSSVRLAAPRPPEAEPVYNRFSGAPAPPPHEPCTGSCGNAAVHRSGHSLHPWDRICRMRRDGLGAWGREGGTEQRGSEAEEVMKIVAPSSKTLEAACS